MMSMIKRGLREILICAVLFIFISQGMSFLRSPTLDRPDLPEFKEILLDQQFFDSTQRSNQPILIYIWATWCSVCRFQSPVIDSIASDIDVLSIAVNSGQDQEVREYMKQHHLTFPVLNDPHHRWSQRFKVSVFPTLFLYNAQGQRKFTEVGYTSWLGLKVRLWWL